MNKRKIDENAIYQTRVTKQAKFQNDKPILEKSIMVFDFMMSLENIVMAKIVNNLWMNPDVQQEIMNISISDMSRPFGKWNEVENKIVAKISKFSLPHLISSKLTYIVPDVGKAICQWMKHFDQVLFYATNYSEFSSKYSSVELISNIAWTARGKIDYAQTSRNILANPDFCLSEDAKFKIACTYCLEEEITLLAPNVVNEYFLDNIDSFMHPMVYFWSIHITGLNIEVMLRGKIENMLYSQYDLQQRYLSINEVIFRILNENDDWDVITFNEVAITCVWNKLTAEEKAKNITTLIKKMDDQGLKYTLLSNLEYEQQQDIFKECSFSILHGILEDWSWEEYFLPTALHFLDVIKPSDFLNILKTVTERRNKISQKDNNFMYSQCKSFFKELWQKCSRNFKDFGFEHENGSFLAEILILLSPKEDMDIIGLILNDLNTQQKKNVISGLHGIKFCSLLIQNDMWDFLLLFIITPSVFSEDEITQFKQALVKERGRSVAVYFLKQNALDKVEHFMNWVFNSQKEIDQFRKSLSHVVICKATLDSIIAHNKADFTKLEIHFNWCARGDLKVINDFKAEVPKSFDVSFFCRLIENDRYGLLEEVLNWCFLDDQQKIVQYKSNLYKDEDYDDFVAYYFIPLIVKLIQKDHSFTMLERFVKWWFPNEQERIEFRTWLLDLHAGIYCVCTQLLCECYFDLADKFLNWCITCFEEVCIYKNTLMLSTEDMEYILNYLGDCSQTELQLLINWFNPSKVTLQEFHSQLLEKKLLLWNEVKYEGLRKIVESLIILKDNKESAL